MTEIPEWRMTEKDISEMRSLDRQQITLATKIFPEIREPRSRWLKYCYNSNGLRIVEKWLKTRPKIVKDSEANEAKRKKREKIERWLELATHFVCVLREIISPCRQMNAEHLLDLLDELDSTLKFDIVKKVPGCTAPLKPLRPNSRIKPKPVLSYLGARQNFRKYWLDYLNNWKFVKECQKHFIFKTHSLVGIAYAIGIEQPEINSMVANGWVYFGSKVSEDKHSDFLSLVNEFQAINSKKHESSGREHYTINEFIAKHVLEKGIPLWRKWTRQIIDLFQSPVLDKIFSFFLKFQKIPVPYDKWIYGEGDYRKTPEWEIYYVPAPEWHSYFNDFNERARARDFKFPSSYKTSCFKVLGITESTGYSEAKQAYRRLARQYHPDTCQDTEATEKMKEVNVAWDEYEKIMSRKR
ncbi:MAG: DnaJ domain-containing protein [Crinalium sp.]